MSDNAQDIPGDNTFDEGLENKKLALENRKWRNRRWMAFFSLGGVLLITVFSMIQTPWVPDARLTAAQNIIEWALIGLTSIVVAYFGFNVLEAKMNKGAAQSND